MTVTIKKWNKTYGSCCFFVVPWFGIGYHIQLRNSTKGKLIFRKNLKKLKVAMKMPKETTYQFLSSDTVGSLCPRLSRPYNSILSFGPASFPLWRLHTCCSLRQRSKVPFLYLKGNEVLSHSNKFLNALKTKLASKQTKNKQTNPQNKMPVHR